MSEYENLLNREPEVPASASPPPELPTVEVWTNPSNSEEAEEYAVSVVLKYPDDYYSGYVAEEAPFGKRVPYNLEEKERTLAWARGVWQRQGEAEHKRREKAKAEYEEWLKKNPSQRVTPETIARKLKK